MTQDAWSAVDAYIAERLLPPDPILDAVLAANAAAGLPAIDVLPAQGKLDGSKNLVLRDLSVFRFAFEAAAGAGPGLSAAEGAVVSR